MNELNESTFLETMAALATILSVIMLAFRNELGWFASISGCILYGIVFLEQKLYANAILQLVFIGQSIYGILQWEKKTNSEFKVLDFPSLFVILLVTTGVCLITSVFVSNFVTSQYVMIDVFLSSLSVVALILLAKKIAQAWFMWMLIDIGYIYLFIKTNMWPSAFLYCLLFLICIVGYFKWKKH